MSGYEKRTKDADFAANLARVNAAVARDPELRAKVDSDEDAFCSTYDRLANQTRTSRIGCYAAPYRPPPEPVDPRPAEEIKRQSMLGKVKSGQIDAGEYLTFLDQTRTEDGE